MIDESKPQAGGIDEVESIGSALPNPAAVDAGVLDSPVVPSPGKSKRPIIPRKREGEFSRLLNAGKSQSIFRVPLSQLPRRFLCVKKYIHAVRDSLEIECVRRYGGVSPTRGQIINSISRTEQAIRIVEKLFRDNVGKLDVEQQASMQERLVRLSEKRDSMLAKLDLDSKPDAVDHWRALDVSPAQRIEAKVKGQLLDSQNSTDPPAGQFCTVQNSPDPSTEATA